MLLWSTQELSFELYFIWDIPAVSLMQSNDCLVLENSGGLPSSQPSRSWPLPVLTSTAPASTVPNSCSCGWFDLLRPVRKAAAGVKGGKSNERKTADTCLYTGGEEQLLLKVTGWSRDLRSCWAWLVFMSDILARAKFPGISRNKPFVGGKGQMLDRLTSLA